MMNGWVIYSWIDLDIKGPGAVSFLLSLSLPPFYHSLNEESLCPAWGMLYASPVRSGGRNPASDDLGAFRTKKIANRCKVNHQCVFCMQAPEAARPALVSSFALCKCNSIITLITVYFIIMRIITCHNFI